MQFKTDIKAQDSLEAIKNTLREIFPDANLDMDLQTADSVLHVHGLPEDSLHAAKVEAAIREAGFNGSWLTRGLENK